MDNRHPRNNRIRQVIDSRLSGMETSPGFERNVLGRVRGEIIVKKKLSTALVLTLVLMLLAMGALAAVLLSARELIEQKAVPMANQSEGNSYSVEETNKLLKLAEENDITLSDEAKKKINKFLSNNQGYYKEEMLMALAKAEFGEAPASWTLEEQKWFGDVCVAIGFIEETLQVIPTVDEISQEQAEKIAEEYIHSHYDKSVNLNDVTVYKRGAQYLNGNVEGEYPGRYWALYYEPLTVTAAGYSIYINSKGEVWKDDVRPGVKEGSDIETIRRKFITAYGWNISAWRQPELQAFQQAIEQSGSTNDKAVLCLKRTEYPNVSDEAMEPERAADIAAKALVLSDYTFMNAVYIGDSPNPVWKVRLVVKLKDGEKNNSDPYGGPFNYYVEVDSKSGEVKSIYKRDINYAYWYLDIVLHKIIMEVDQTWTDTSKSFG